MKKEFYYQQITEAITSAPVWGLDFAVGFLCGLQACAIADPESEFVLGEILDAANEALGRITGYVQISEVNA